ncbi:MAG: hypothetical protein J6D29_00570 [Solobacterium sp.]|nr:hypothetical protein [Solobacterium sp.]
MRIGRKVLNWLSLVLLVAGVCCIAFGYLTNRSFLTYIEKLLADAEFGKTLKLILLGVGLILVSLILFSFSLRLGSRIRKIDKAKKEEEEHQRSLEEELHQRTKAEAETARAEADRFRQEADQAKAELAAMQTSEIQTEEEPE